MSKRENGAPGRNNDDIISDAFTIDGKPGDDVITDESGHANVNAGSGDDTVIHVLGDDTGGTYKGGSGVDTLEISLTTEQWLSLAPVLQAELDAYIEFLENNTNPSGQANGNSFVFSSLGLSVKQFENLVLRVDGVAITPGDDPVDAVDDPFATDNETAISGNVLDNDSVPDLVSGVTLVSGPSEGTLTFNSDGSFSFDPGADFDDLGVGEFRSTSFTYEVSDANGDTDQAVVTISVEGTNHAPVANDDAATANEDMSYVLLDFLGNDTDEDGDTLTVTAVETNGAPGLVVYSAGLGGWVYQWDAADYNSLASGQQVIETFDYDIADGNGGTASASLLLTIEGRNDGPSAVADAYTVEEDGTAVSAWPSVLDNDSDPDDGDTLRVGSLQGVLLVAGLASVDVTSVGGRSATVEIDEDGNIDLLTGGNFEDLGAGDTDQILVSYTAVDGSGASASADVTLTVQGENDGPEAIDDAFGVSEAGTSSLLVTGNDSDPDNGDSISITGITQPAEGSVSVSGDGLSVIFDPGAAFEGLSTGQTATVSFDYTIEDSFGLSDTATVTLTVNGDGTFAPTQASASDTDTGTNGQPVTATLLADGQTNDGTGEATVRISLGAVVQTAINVHIAIDTSGSTQAFVGGASVGDVNHDGRANTILDVEIAAVQSLIQEIASAGYGDGVVTFNLVPFATTPHSMIQVVLDASDDPLGGPTDIDVLNQHLESLRDRGVTNYVETWDAITTQINALDPGDTESDFVYFISDGVPTPIRSTPYSYNDPFFGSGQYVQSEATLAAAATALQGTGATISAFGVGNNVNPVYLDMIDNTNGSQVLTDPNALSGALLDSPVPSAAVIDADVFVFDETDTQIAAFDLDPGDFAITPFGLEADIAGIAGLGAYVGDTNTLQLVVQFDSDDDGIADMTLETELSVVGVLPESFDGIV